MTETTPQELREAARLMRERATVASTPPWSVRVIPSRRSGFDLIPEAHMIMAGGQNIAKAGQCDAAHIAGMHPGVALAVADWLDRTAWAWEMQPDARYRVGGDEAFAVARAYLGTKEASADA